MVKDNRNGPVVDLTAAPANPVRTRSPWTTIREFIDRNGFGLITVNRSKYGVRTVRFNVRLGRSRATFEARFETLSGGDLLNVQMDTMTVDPGAVDPPGYSNAVSIQFDRPKDNMLACDGYVNLISAKPSHGVLSGTDAIGIAIALARAFGCRTLSLHDGSALDCPDGSGDPISLRRARILSRGAGWYESKGFRSLIEALEPDKYRRTVGRLHTVRVADLLKALRASDEGLRAAVAAGRPGFGALNIAAYNDDEPEPEVHSGKALSIKHVVDALQQASVACERLQGRDGETLGAVVDSLISSSCRDAADLVDALLPMSSTFSVVLVAPDGSAVPQLPMMHAWVFAWRLVSHFSNMTLRL